jgi:hypothetical protein
LDAERPAPPSQDRRPFSEVQHAEDLGRSRVPAHRISRYLRMLDLHGVGVWLNEHDGEPWDDGAHFFCPRCQPTQAKQWERAPGARVLADGITYRCGWCREEGTHERVVDAVLRRPSALRRVAEYLAEVDG